MRTANNLGDVFIWFLVLPAINQGWSKANASFLAKLIIGGLMD
jgi:hypothetical protein